VSIMMRYKIRHTTAYQYSEPVPLSQNQLRLTPRNRGGQKLLRRRLHISPKPELITHRRDYFANLVSHFDVYEPHGELVITSHAEVVVDRPVVEVRMPSSSWDSIAHQLKSDITSNGLHRYQFTFPSVLAPKLPVAYEYAVRSFPKGRPILPAAFELIERIHKDFVYDPTATNVTTTVPEVFQKKRGVCQDLAHVALSCFRSLGLAASYVSGYVRTYSDQNQAELVGADASHAWISLFAGSLGWVDFDPTNKLIVQNEHVVLAIGRDYRDVCPVNGLFIGGGKQSLSVSVRLKPEKV
jgi:transglutaminase-like putative cysteine protease